MSITHSQGSKKDVSLRSASLSSKTKSEKVLHKIEPLPGALVKQYMKCGKPNCKCAKGFLHGPYFCRFVRVSGRLRKIYVKKADFQAVSAAILARRRNDAEIREMIKELKRDSRQLADLLSAYSRLCRIGL